VTKIYWDPPGARTEIIVLNISGHDVQIDLIRFAEHRDHFTRPLEPSARMTRIKRSFTTKRSIFATSNLGLSLWRSDTRSWTPESNGTHRSSLIDSRARNAHS
jgi:hypothetical protein